MSVFAEREKCSRKSVAKRKVCFIDFVFFPQRLAIRPMINEKQIWSKLVTSRANDADYCSAFRGGSV